MMDKPSHDSAHRTRSKTVCQSCRQRKVACSREFPRCGFCLRNNIECQYVTSQKRPGLRAGFVSLLEQRIIDLESRVKDLEAEKEIATDTTRTPSQQPLTIAESPEASLDRSFDRFNPSATSTSPNSNASVASTVFKPLSPTVLNELCNTWFEKYHPWFPILHQPSLLEALQTYPAIDTSTHQLVIKAIVAVTVLYCRTAPSTPSQSQQWSGTLRDRVIMDAMKQVSLQSVQALLVLSNLDYGGGQAHQFWNLMALCKRMNTSLGMRDLVTNQGDNFNKLSTVPPRMLPLPDTIIDREERIRAYGMTEILDGASTLGVAWNLGISPPEGTAILPCSDSIWKFPQHIISVWSFGDFHFSSAFSLCIILVASELCHVHRFLQKSVDTRVHDQRLKWQQESQQLDERLTAWRGEFVAAVCLINAEYVQEERAEFDPNIVLTNCILDTAVIALFQRLAPSPIGIDNHYEAWPYATNRCLYACDDMTAKIRQVRDKELENSSPHLIYSMFVAARFYLVYAKAVAADIPRNLHLLAYALRICGERWVLARRYETVIRTAVAEHHMPIGVMSSLPVQFFDLQYSTLDIDEALRIWVANIMLSGASGPGMGASGELNGVS